VTEPGLFYLFYFILCYSIFEFLTRDYLCSVGLGLLYIFVVNSSSF